MDNFLFSFSIKINPFLLFFLFGWLLLQSSCQGDIPTQFTLEKKDGMILIPSGTLHMGGDNDQASANEFPKHDVIINSFWMDETEVTNTQFQKFVEATNYKTIAERPVN